MSQLWQGLNYARMVRWVGLSYVNANMALMQLFMCKSLNMPIKYFIDFYLLDFRTWEVNVSVGLLEGVHRSLLVLESLLIVLFGLKHMQQRYCLVLVYVKTWSTAPTTNSSFNLLATEFFMSYFIKTKFMLTLYWQYILWNHLISWGPIFVVWRRWICS